MRSSYGRLPESCPERICAEVSASTNRQPDAVGWHKIHVGWIEGRRPPRLPYREEGSMRRRDVILSAWRHRGCVAAGCTRPARPARSPCRCSVARRLRTSVSPIFELFREGLREAGYIEGYNLTIELRYSRRGSQYLPELAAELVRLNVEVIQASGDFAPKVAQKASGTIPILAFTDDVLGADLVASLSRPGGNTTGLTILSPELSAKRLEILVRLFPACRALRYFGTPTAVNRKSQ